MLRHHTGSTSLEYIIVAAIVVAIIGSAVVALADALQAKLTAYNTQIGS